MVATLAQAASAAYYLESQRSFRHPNEYYTAGEEPDGVWFNPHGLFGLADGGKVDSSDFHRLYHGFAPNSGGKLTQNAGSERRSAGLDMTFSADKSISALWAMADPELRTKIEDAHNDAARVALEQTVLRHCAYTRIRNRDGDIEVLPADIAAAMFQHGTSRDNDPQLHTHCVIFNAARTHGDGKYRALHQHPVYGWMKAAGAVYRNALAWRLQEHLGLSMEQYGKDGEFTRLVGMPEDLIGHWSKRRAAIIEAAHNMGFTVEGNAARAAAANKITRAGKSPDNDPEIRHARWRGEAEGFVEREALIAALLDKAEAITQQQIRALTEVLEDLPDRLTREEAVFRLPDIVERVGNATAGLLNHDAVATSIERVLLSPEVVRLTRPPRSAEGRADMAHTRLYSTRNNLEMEMRVREMAAGMAVDTGLGLYPWAIEAKVTGLLKAGYPLSEEQITAIRTVTSSGGRVAIIEGAAGSGKTTTLRPIADLYREHGNAIIATAVAWRTAVALGNDVDARPFCVDKLLRLGARGGIEIDKYTTIIVDEAGMLSTRQAHHILQLSERHGAKIVFAGDTQQQQPVEAGPGLRLIRDAVGSVRVDRIRRQKADLEDILVHVHGETPEAARLRAKSMAEEKRTHILSYYENMNGKPNFTPWQVAASEALRDGNAAAAIAAHHLRGRFHIGYDEEKTLTGLVDDWDRYQRANPDKSSVVLARTRAEVRALSHLMRERRFAVLPEGDQAGTEQTHMERVTVYVSRGTEDERASSPLEIARGDCLRIGATHWEKQLFNGTVVTVDDFKVQGGETEGEPSVLITGHTEDGRNVSFRHDEIRDWYGNIRLDHGYAMTITSAQGLTVDRTFLLTDARPARETIYPAATRHRERLDIYVNRAPLALDIADRRADNDREAAVTDTEIRTYLAERWSRSQPKEAALDYMSDGVWEERREDVRQDRGRTAGETQDETGTVRAAANDNVLARIARDIRRTVFGWRHAQTVASFDDGRREVLAAYDDLRERTRAEGDAVALGGTFQETLTRHAVLLKQAETFRARPDDFASLLNEHGGIGRKDLDAFEELHTRARRHRRAATMRHVHRIKREAEQQESEPKIRQGELTLEGGGAKASRHAETVARDTAEVQSPDHDATPSRHVDPVPPVETEAYPGAHAVPVQEDVPPPVPDQDPPKPDWYTPYMALREDWNTLIAGVGQSGDLIFYAKGYADLIARIQALAENPDVPAETRVPLIEALENHQRNAAARKHIQDYLDQVDGHLKEHDAIEREAEDRGIEVADVSGYPQWRQETARLTTAGEAILSDRETYAPHLQDIAGSEERVEGALLKMSRTIERDDDAVRESTVESRKQPARPKTPEENEGQSRTMDPGTQRTQHDAAPGAENPVTPPDAAPVRKEEPAKPYWYASYMALREDWNAFIKDTPQSGTFSFYARGYADMIPRIRVFAENPDVPTVTRAPMTEVLENHQRCLSARNHIEDYLDEVNRHLEEHDAMKSRAEELNKETAQVSAYPEWREEAVRLTAAGDAVVSDEDTYGAHLDNIVLGRTRMERALSELGDTIRSDDEDLAERQNREQRERARQSTGLLFAMDTGGRDATADPAVSADDTRVRAALFRLRRAFDFDGSVAERDRQAANKRLSLERWETLKQDWHGQVEQAERQGVHVIYTHGYDRLREKLRSTADSDPYVDEPTRSEMHDVLLRLDKAKASREHAEKYRDHIVKWLDHRRELLEPRAAERGVAVPDHADYDLWRDVTDEAVDVVRYILANRDHYDIHLDSIASRGQGLESAFAPLRQALREDDRHIAASLAGQRKGEDIAMREQRVARLLDDPEKLRELRQQRAERKAGKQQRKGRHWSMRI